MASNREKKISRSFSHNLLLQESLTEPSKQLSHDVRKRTKQLQKTFSYKDIFLIKAKMDSYKNFHIILPVVKQITDELLEIGFDEAKAYLDSVKDLVSNVDSLLNFIDDVKSQIANFNMLDYQHLELRIYRKYRGLAFSNSHEDDPWVYARDLKREIMEYEAITSVECIKNFIATTQWEFGKFQKKEKVQLGAEEKEVPRKVGMMVDSIKRAEANEQNFLYTIRELNILSNAGIDKFRFFDSQHKKHNRYVAINNLTISRLGK